MESMYHGAWHSVKGSINVSRHHSNRHHPYLVGAFLVEPDIKEKYKYSDILVALN